MNQHTISKDSPCLFATSVANRRLPVFQTDTMKSLMCAAMNEARQSGNFLIFAYCIMPDHVHIVADSSRKPSDIVRFINGISSRRILDYLKSNGFKSSLEKLRHEKGKRQYQYSLWEHHPDTFLLTTEAAFMEKVNYIHMNPVRAGLAERAEEYRWSSARCWKKSPWRDEPLLVDIDQIVWRPERLEA
jgi:putative transposase